MIKEQVESIFPPPDFKLKVADGRECRIVGSVKAELWFDGALREMQFFVVPSLKRELILGIDFWRLFQLNIDMKNNVISSGVSRNVRKAMEVQENNPNVHEQIDTGDGEGASDYCPDKVLGNGGSFFVDHISTEPVIISEDFLKQDQKERLREVVEKYHATLGREDLGCTSLYTHTIDTGDAKPVRSKCYNYSPKMLEDMHRGLDKWLKLGVVEPSTSEWSSPVMILPKANGADGEDGRWVVDLRRVNALAKSDAYRSLPVNTIIDQLRDARCLSSIDLRSAFFQVELDKPSREKTAFVVPGRGLFQFTRMPQGLNSSAAAWQRLIDRVLGFDLQPRVFAYLDDIIIVSSDFDSHLNLVHFVAP